MFDYLPEFMKKSFMKCMKRKDTRKRHAVLTLFIVGMILCSFFNVYGLLITMAEHQLDPNEQQNDHQKPGTIQVTSIQVTRGRAVPAGQWVEDADIGSITINVNPPSDNRTPADKMGYYIRHKAGKLPGANMLPTKSVRAIKRPDGTYYLVLYWTDGATNTHPPIQFILSIEAIDLGGNVGQRTSFTVCDPPLPKRQPDEISYNPKNLVIINEGVQGWLLTDGVSRMKMFDNQQDAQNGLAVAKRYTRLGCVGRNNHRPNRLKYIMEYWAGNSGLTWSSLTKTDRIPYIPTKVYCEDRGIAGWRLVDDKGIITLADNRADAVAQLEIIAEYRYQCFIGRDNHRQNRDLYIMTYWE